jgi:hypothetical protein
MIGPDVAMRLAHDQVVIREEHQILAPALLRSQLLSLLYQAVRRNEMTRKDAQRSVSSAQQRYAERADFPERVTAADHRILLHDLPRGMLVGCLEDDQASVDRSQGRAGEDELAAGQQALQPLEMLCPDGLLIGCHRRSEVITRRVDEVNPFRHGPSLPRPLPPRQSILSREVPCLRSVA